MIQPFRSVFTFCFILCHKKDDKVGEWDITQIGQKISKMDKNGGWLKWTGGKLILCGWAQFDSSNTTFIGSTIDRGPAQQRDFG